MVADDAATDDDEDIREPDDGAKNGAAGANVKADEPLFNHPHCCDCQPRVSDWDDFKPEEYPVRAKQ